MRRLIFALALLASVPALAQDYMVGFRRRGVSAPTANILNETFTDTVGGYHVSGWTETLTGGCGSCTVNESKTSGCPTGTGWATDCMETSVPASGDLAFTEWDALSGQGGTVYVTLHFVFSSSAAWFDTQEQTIFSLDNQNIGVPSASNAAAIAYLAYYVNATSDPETPDCGAYPCFRLNLRIGGTALVPAVEITPGVTLHNLRYLLNPGSATGSITYDGSPVLTGVDSDLNGHGSWEWLRIGLQNTSGGATVIYWDDVNVSSTGYVD